MLVKANAEPSKDDQLYPKVAKTLSKHIKKEKIYKTNVTHNMNAWIKNLNRIQQRGLHKLSIKPQ